MNIVQCRNKKPTKQAKTNKQRTKQKSLTTNKSSPVFVFFCHKLGITEEERKDSRQYRKGKCSLEMTSWTNKMIHSEGCGFVKLYVALFSSPSKTLEYQMKQKKLMSHKTCCLVLSYSQSVYTRHATISSFFTIVSTCSPSSVFHSDLYEWRMVLSLNFSALQIWSVMKAMIKK